MMEKTPAASPPVRAAPLAKRVRRELRVRALLVLLPLLSRLPHRLAVAFGAACGWLAWFAVPRHRRAAMEHLAIAFPERDASWRARVGRASFANLGRSAMEVLIADRVDLARAVQLEPGSMEVVSAALAEGRGAVAFSCHLGNWELLARRMALEGVPLATIAREARDPRLTALLERSRSLSGVKSLWRGDPGAVRAMIQHVRGGGIVAALIDQDTEVAGYFLPFFGREAFTPRAPADLALRTGAAALFARTRRVAPTLHRITISRAPIPGGEDADVASRELSAWATREIEAEVRRTPDQWVWMHARWRTRPSSMR
ncbi:MAG TPA: lipid A biosynthesis acyltransferase [Myxococcales bacterium]|nr:lipid A biosynthesis acyltransferase [Myxococcales bacterium]